MALSPPPRAPTGPRRGGAWWRRGLGSRWVRGASRLGRRHAQGRGGAWWRLEFGLSVVVRASRVGRSGSGLWSGWWRLEFGLSVVVRGVERRAENNAPRSAPVSWGLGSPLAGPLTPARPGLELAALPARSRPSRAPRASRAPARDDRSPPRGADPGAGRGVSGSRHGRGASRGAEGASGVTPRGAVGCGGAWGWALASRLAQRRGRFGVDGFSSRRVRFAPLRRWRPW